MDYPEAHICLVENGVSVELYDVEVAKSNQDSEHYESPWKKFVEPDLESAFALIRAKLPTGKSKSDAMMENSSHENHMAIRAAKSRFGGSY